MGLGPGEIVYCLIWEQKNNWKEKLEKGKREKESISFCGTRPHMVLRLIEGKTTAKVVIAYCLFITVWVWVGKDSESYVL